MPRYDFECDRCGDVREHVFRMSEMPSSIACECGGAAHSVISDRIEVIARGNEKPPLLAPWSLPVGWEKGNTDAAAQERAYAQIHAESKKAALANDKQAIKNGMRLIARQPREHFRMRTNQFGKDYYRGGDADTKAKLKEDGLLFKD